jgi:hypothetical protein
VLWILTFSKHFLRAAVIVDTINIIITYKRTQSTTVVNFLFKSETIHSWDL